MAPSSPAPDDEHDAAPAAGDERGPIQSIDRAANVLSLFDEHTRSLTPAFVAERLGLNRTTAHRYLQALLGAGFLSSGYGPGPLIDQLAALVSSRQQIVTLAPPVLRRLSDLTGLTAVMSFLGRSGAVVALVEEAAEGTILLTVRVGTVLELRAAQTRVLLAYQTDPETVTRALHTLPAAEMRGEQQELAKARRDGIAWADLGRTGLESVAAPVFGSGHEVQAAIGILGTTTMFEGDAGARRIAALREAANEISAIVAG